MPPFDSFSFLDDFFADVKIAPPSPRVSPQAAAAEIVCRQLESPEMRDLWALHRHSQAEENIPGKIAQAIRRHADDLDARPDLKDFVSEFLLAELRGSKDDPVLTEQHAELAALYNALPQQRKKQRSARWGVPHRLRNGLLLQKESRGPFFSRHAMREDMPQWLKTGLGPVFLKSVDPGTYHIRHMMTQECKQVLDMVDIQLQQKPLTYLLRDILAEYAKHFDESAKKNPKAFTAVLAACFGAGAFMRSDLKTTRIDPASAGLSIDPVTLLPTTVSISPDQITPNMNFGCHHHLPSFLGEDIRATIGTALDDMGLKHGCAVFKDLDIRAQDLMKDGWNILKTPFNAVMDTFAGNPLQDLGTQDFLTSRFWEAYNATAPIVADIIYNIDMSENFLFHGFIAAAGFIEGYAQSGPSGGHEARETLSAAGDFFRRTWDERKMVYMLPVITTGATWAAQGHWDSVPAMAGVAAGAAAHVACNLKKKWDRAANIKGLTQHAGSLLKDFRNSVKEKGVSETFIEPARKSWLSTKEKVAWAGASLSAYASILFMDVGGYAQTIENEAVREGILGASGVLGAATVTTVMGGVFVPYNAVTDLSQHIIFGLTGYGAGRLWGAAVGLKPKWEAPRPPGSF